MTLAKLNDTTVAYENMLGFVRPEFDIVQDEPTR